MSIWGIANTCLGHGAPIVKRPGPVPNPSVDDGRCSVFQVLQTLAIRYVVTGDVGTLGAGLHIGSGFVRGQQTPVERLLTKTVTGRKQPSLARVPDREREHAVEPRQTLAPPFQISVDDYFGVCLGAKNNPARLKLAAQFFEVVNLPVEGEPDLLARIRHRLVTGWREIND